MSLWKSYVKDGAIDDLLNVPTWRKAVYKSPSIHFSLLFNFHFSETQIAAVP